MGNERSRKSKFGRLLNRYRDRVIGGWKLRVLGTDRNGGRIYRLDRAETPSNAHNAAPMAQKRGTLRNFATEVPRVSPEVEGKNAELAELTFSLARKLFEGERTHKIENNIREAKNNVRVGWNEVPQVPRNGSSPEVEGAELLFQSSAPDDQRTALRGALALWMEAGKPATYAQMRQWTAQARALGLRLDAGPATRGGGAGSAVDAWTFPNAAAVLEALGPRDILEELGL